MRDEIEEKKGNLSDNLRIKDELQIDQEINKFEQ